MVCALTYIQPPVIFGVTVKHMGNITYIICLSTEDSFRTSIDADTGVVKLFIPASESGEAGHELLVCRNMWDMAAANVACKEHGNPL